MELSENGAKFIKRFEGYRTNAYLCSANVWTIGYGNTTYPDGRRVKAGDKITREEAEKLFNISVSLRVRYVNEYLIDKGIKLSQNAFDSIVSFIYNVGIGAFLKGSVYRYLLQGNIEKAGEFLLKYDKAYSTKLKKMVQVNGLTRRRKEEYSLLMSKDDVIHITKEEAYKSEPMPISLFPVRECEYIASISDVGILIDNTLVKSTNISEYLVRSIEE
jgi:lysozyme